MHIGKVKAGEIRTGDSVEAKVDSERREAIRRNHTSVHLLQAALQQVLGDHVHQAGSYVDDKYSRFDFTHFEAVKPEELKKVETLVNRKILEAIPVTTEVLPIEEAKKQGAMALFGEKYGDMVRVVSVGDFSKEFCGGTHAANTSNLGLYRIIGESSVASGIRRIEAVTGMEVLRLMDEQKELLSETASVLKVGAWKELPSKAASVVAETKRLEQEIAKQKDRESASQVKDIEKNGVKLGDFTYYTGNVGAVSADVLRNMVSSLRDGKENAVVLLASVNDGKVTLCAGSSKGAVSSGIRAGNLVRAAANAMGGNGGGKDDLAMAGGKNADMIADAFEAAKSLLK